MDSYKKLLAKQLRESEKELLGCIAMLTENEIKALPTGRLEELVLNYKDRLSHIQDS